MGKVAGDATRLKLDMPRIHLGTFSPASCSGTTCPKPWAGDLLLRATKGCKELPLANSLRTHPFSEGTMTGTPAPANCAFSPESCYSECPEENNKAAL